MPEDTQTISSHSLSSEPIVNVAHHLRTMARIQPYRRAVVFPAARNANGHALYSHLTFRQLDRESDCLARGLDQVGIRRGTRTILMVRPSLEFFVITFAMFKVGAVPVMVDPGMGLQRMLECLRESRAQAMIGIPKAHVLRILRPAHFKNVKISVTIGKRWFWRGLTLKHIRSLPWQLFPIVNTTRDETAAILFTTGSTGPAKGVVYTHGIFDAQVRMIKEHFGISPDEIDLPTFPLFSLFDPALGMTAVIPDMDPTRPALVNPCNIIEAVINHGVTNMFASPALLNRVGAFGKENSIKLPSLKRVISAGAPAKPADIDRFSKLLQPEAEIHTAYGATEAMPVSAFSSREILSETAHLTEKGFGMCVGKPIKGVDVRIIAISDESIDVWSDDLQVASESEIGEIAVAGDIVTKSYFERSLDDSIAKIRDGDRIWHRMGDLGWLDKKGRIWFCGRKNHRVIAQDHVLFTIPCEAVFNNHPAVFRSALVGVGQVPQQPVICIELKPENRDADPEMLRAELLELAKKNVLTEKITTFLFHPQFPVDIRHNSKIFREKLAAWAASKLAAAKPEN